MISQHEIDKLISDIVEGYDPEKIYLFGSYANGLPNSDSDVDLFIVKRTNKRSTERSMEVRGAIKTYPFVGLDIIVYTPEELESVMQDVVNIGKEAVTTGKLLYERI